MAPLLGEPGEDDEEEIEFLMQIELNEIVSDAGSEVVGAQELGEPERVMM